METQSRKLTISEELKKDSRELLKILWEEFPGFYEVLHRKGSLEQIRKRVYTYILVLDKEFHESLQSLHQLEIYNAKQCLRVLYNVFKPENEELSGESALTCLKRLTREGDKFFYDVKPAFIAEFLYLFRGATGSSRIYDDSPQLSTAGLEGIEAAKQRSLALDELAYKAQEIIGRYTSGLDPEVVERRKKRVREIAAAMNASEDDWKSWKWQIGHVIRSADLLEKFIKISDEHREAVRLAIDNKVPFGLTPHYLSLMDVEPSDRDRAVRAQVIPDLGYVKKLIEFRNSSPEDLDFMRERDTAPETLITRRYPMVAILKPINTCPQICVYCQRNWEIYEAMDSEGLNLGDQIDRAVEWIGKTTSLREVLITGGDPALMSDRKLDELMGRLAVFDHIQRIRIGTRMPVTVPQRVTENFADVLAKYYEPGKRDVCLVTHFEHLYEICPESVEAITRIRKRGISVYNQLVYTYYNSRRFENVATKTALQLIGVQPYYTFNTQGKQETRSYLVPISRILQEQREETRLIPGVLRTDKAVFNVPGLGKNYLHAWQNHEVIMIRPDGGRSITFLPWEKNIQLADIYVYKDVPIYDYLRRLMEDGEDVNQYKNIWYYF